MKLKLHLLKMIPNRLPRYPFTGNNGADLKGNKNQTICQLNIRRQRESLLTTNTNCEVELSYFCLDLELLDNRIACFSG